MFVVLLSCLVDPVWHCDHLLGKLVCGLCTVCQGLFDLPLGVIGKLCSVTVALPGYFLYFYQVGGGWGVGGGRGRQNTYAIIKGKFSIFN